ncbi:TPA: hypothetical protein ACJIYU_004434 [Yersinia enterocolitica]|nr:hypothetical protein [Yersinia enterocolitica]HDL7316247.1 hypothetical protein [Yersinia enterocolitica]HEN3238331.1 hypothetical protein [Yersinia enterocolitica]HEN3333762.1 hypothetical protein [Yersinia enterocolitica]HEN3412022.1 hypothetical protein [Yersinia enterocolitica]
MPEKIQYICRTEGWVFPGNAEDIDPAYSSDGGPEFLAAIAAEDYWERFDGWESNWPLSFEIFIDGVSAGNFSVDMEQQPTFSATKIAGVTPDEKA